MTHIAFFGGAFDPPHLGHRAVCQWLVRSGHFDAIWIVPAYRHPFQKSMSVFDQRLAMCTLAFADIPKVAISPIEKETGISHTYELLQFLKAQHPTYQFTLIVGSDTLGDLDKWKNADALRREIPILEISRQGWRDSPFPEWQSSQIRQAIARGEDQSAQVGEKVMDYIRREGLYRG